MLRQTQATSLAKIQVSRIIVLVFVGDFFSTLEIFVFEFLTSFCSDFLWTKFCFFHYVYVPFFAFHILTNLD